METAILLLFFYLMNGSDNKEQLRSFLSFYRENRELLASLLGTAQPAPASETASAATVERAATAETAQTVAGTPSQGSSAASAAILEEYLRRYS